jgi:hypothetical protein
LVAVVAVIVHDGGGGGGGSLWVGGDCLGFWLLKGKVTLEI